MNAHSNCEWEYEIGKEEIELDNGLFYTPDCMMPFYLDLISKLVELLEYYVELNITLL